MRMYLLDKKQRVRRWLKDNDFIEAEMTEEINAANQINFSMPLKDRIADNIYYVAIPTPHSKQKYLLFKLLSERVQNDRIEYQGIEEAYDELKQYGYIKDIRPNDRTAEEMLKMVLEPTRWTLGNVPETNHQSTNFYYITYLEALQKIVGLFNIELTFEVTIDPKSNKITRRQVNVYNQQGQRTGKRFEYGSNLLTIEQEQDSQELITALVGRGKGEQVSEGHDDTPDGYGRRITFADVVWTKKDGNPVDKPAGQEYLVDPEATELYGFSDGNPRIGLTVFEDIEDPIELINATWKALQSLKRPKVSFKASVTDVGKLGLGDTVAIIRHDLKIEYFTRVYKVKHDLLNENNNQIELGDDFSSHSITNSIIKVDGIANEARETAGHAAIAANGKNNNYYSSVQPLAPIEGDIWYKDLGNGETDMYQYHNGGWVFIQSTRDLHVVENQVKEAQQGLNQAKADIINNKQKADADIENLSKSIEDNKKVADQDIQNLNKSIEANKKVADESLKKLNDSVTNLQGQYDNNIVPNLNKVIADASDALQKYITAQSSIADLTKRAQQQGKDIADVTNTVKGLNINYANLAGDVNSTKVDVKGLQTIVGTANGDIAQLKLDAQNLQTMLAGKVDNTTYTNFVNLTNQALNARLTASDLSGYAKTVDVQATANGLRVDLNSVTDRMNNLKVGGRNLIPNSGTDIVIESKTTDPYPAWDNKAVYWDLTPGETYTFSVSATNTNGVEQASVRIFKGSLDGKYINKEAAHWYFNADGKRHNFTFTTPNDAIPYDIWLYAGPMGTLQGKDFTTTYHHPQLEVGTVATDYRPAPEDVANDITQLSARITANSQQFSSYYTKSETNTKTNIAKNDAVNAIKSDSNWTGLKNVLTNSGFLQTADGFLQKVQQTTVPMFNGGGVNLLLNTQNFDHNWAWDNIDHSYAKGVLTLSDTNNGNSRMYQGLADNPAGKTFSLAFNAKISADCDSENVSIKAGPYDAPKWITVTGKNSQSYKIEGWKWTGTSANFSLYVIGGKIDISNLKLEYGSVATPYSPNPADLATQSAFSELSQSLEGLRSTVGSNYGSLQSQISQSSSSIRTELTDKIKGIDNKTTSTADSLNSVIGRVGSLENLTNFQVINNAINANDYTNTGNYFIKSTANTNVPGTNWCYLKVERVNDGRIVQTWQSDSDPTLRYVRTKFSDSWTQWQRSASYSEYSELNRTVQGLQSTVSNNHGELQSQISQTATTIRGELTNKITGLQTQLTNTAEGLNAKIGAIQIGGRNYLRNSDKSIFGWGQDLGTMPNEVLNSLAGETITVSVDTEWSNYQHSDSNQNRLGFELSVKGSDGKGYWFGAWKSPTTPSGKERVSTTYTLPANVTFTVGNNGQNGYVSINGSGKVSHVKIEIGDRMTDWSPAPEDAEQAFAEVNATINGLKSTVSGNYGTLNSQINQTASTIRQEVSDKTNGLQTQINQQANNFNVSLNSLRKETAWQKVTSAIDANNYTTTGNYWIQAAPNSNTPDGSAWAYLQVVAYPDVQRIKQTWQRDNNANEAYTRLKTGNTWSDWQKTVTAGNIMAQINMSAGTTLIQNNKIYMDADSTIFSGKAFIPDAAISNLSADKITTGTLNAGLINVINLNASSITTGTINGANLKIDLNNGEVQFKRGRITSIANTLNINIDTGTMSVTDGVNNGVYFANGELKLMDDPLNITGTPKYGGLRRSAHIWSPGSAGAELHSPNGVFVGSDNYNGAFAGGSGIDGTSSGAALAVDKDGSATLNGANIVSVSGGRAYDIGYSMKNRPAIILGKSQSGWNPGDRTFIQGAFVHIESAYRNTNGASPNVYVAPDGALVRSTSASKYKTDIQRSYVSDYGERLLELPTATWMDKAETERYVDGESQDKPVRHFGMIAEDLADAGLEMLVSRGQDGELEGIQYDRIGPALIPVIKQLQDKVNKLEEKLNER